MAKKFDLDSSTISHYLYESEFFHGKLLRKSLKFKIFKAKKRAALSYNALVEESKDDVRFKLPKSKQLFISEYTYNYPYDNFSLVELAKVSVDLTVEKTQTSTKIAQSTGGTLGTPLETIKGG